MVLNIKMMKNGVYFIKIALLVAELFKISIYANKMSVTLQKGHKVVQNNKKIGYLCKWEVYAPSA